MNQGLMQTLMSILQVRSPQGFQRMQQMINAKQDPNALVKQVMGNMPPQQKQAILQQAKSYGCPNEILSKIQNMK